MQMLHTKISSQIINKPINQHTQIHKHKNIIKFIYTKCLIRINVMKNLSHCIRITLIEVHPYKP